MSAPSPTRPATDLHLEGVRGIACLLVALGHTLYLTHLDPSVVLPGWLRSIEAAHAAVLVFFVLSGYLISWTNTGSCTRQNRRAYVRRRFIRLAPIYYVALGLTVVGLYLRQDHGQFRAVAAAALCLQNFNDYFGLHLPLPMVNGPLWSLNYEVLYYGLFILLWRFEPRLRWIFIPAAIATVLGWFAPQVMPLFIASYACGWLFWAAGWWLARQPATLPTDAPAPVATWLLLVFAGHQIAGVTRIFNALGWYCNDAGMVTLGDIGLLPPILLLLGAITHRQLPARTFLAALAWLICLVPLGGMVWTGRLWTQPAWITGGGAVLLAAALWRVRSTAWIKPFAWLGGISYAFYVVHFPLLFIVQLSPLPAGSIPAYFLRWAVWAVLALGLAWFLERRFQPWVKRRVAAPAPTQT